MDDYFAGYLIKDGETFIDSVCRTIPLRRRALSGLSLKMVSIRFSLKNNEGKYTQKDLDKIKKEIKRINKMTDEEYESEKK